MNHVTFPFFYDLASRHLLRMLLSIEFTVAAIVNLLLIPCLYYLWQLVQLEVEDGVLPQLGARLMIISLLCLLRRHIKGAQYEGQEKAAGKNIIITGSNAGIGKALAQELGLRGAQVYMACRSVARAEATKRELVKNGVNASNVHIYAVDLCDLSSVRRFAEKFTAEVGSLDVLVCNAGVWMQTAQPTTKDGNELHLQANFLGHQLLTECLLPVLRKTAGARVVNISSIMHLYYSYSSSGDSYNFADEVHGTMAYCRSKLSQVLMTSHLQELEQSSNEENPVSFVSCHPGNVHSSILDQGLLSFLRLTWLRYLVSFVLKAEKDGAQTPLYCCLSNDVVPGAYHHECSPATKKTNAQVNDVQLKKRLAEFVRNKLDS